MNEARYYHTGSGTTTAALAATGLNPPSTYKGLTEEFTGAGQAVGAWSTGGSLNTARYYVGAAGTQTAGLAFGGETPYRAQTESYDGSSWTEVNDMNTAVATHGSNGTQTSALAYGGDLPPSTAQTES